MGQKFNLLTTLLLFWGATVMAQSINSPNSELTLNFELDQTGAPHYALSYKSQDVIKSSKMGFTLHPTIDWSRDFEIEGVTFNDVNESWEPVWGEESKIEDNHKEMAVTLRQKATQRRMTIRFRLFNDGLGFRYEFPYQDELRHFVIVGESTEFNLTGDHKAFWMPADYDTNEYPTTTSKLSEISSLIDEVLKEPLAAKSPSATLAVQTPLMLKSENNLYINIHEAALINFPAMALDVDDESFTLTSHLTPDVNGMRGFIDTGSVTPWRTIVVSDDAREILASRLILNLNEPTKFEDTSWITPIKYIGVWWEYFVGGGSQWSYTDSRDITISQTDYTKLEPHNRHGANTEHVKEYIDFAAENGFDAVLVEGWNEGWEDNYAYHKERIYSFTKAYPDFDVEHLHEYAKSKGVRIMMHHETTSSVIDYERQMEDAFKFMVENGYNSVKTGYVGRIIPRSEYHDGQWMVNHYIYVADKAARHKIMVNSHEAVRPTGLCRTYPNWIAQESARGTEFESFNGNSQDHTTILPFTRLMGGPMDYTPGIFEGDLSVYGDNKAQLSTTLAKQLALYVTMYSPLQMAADLIENYRRFPDAFQFIKDVAVDWDKSYVLEAEPGDYITIARKAKGKNEWFVGAITDENSRYATIDLSMLESGKKYTATIYADGKDAHWSVKPKSYKITTKSVDSKSVLKLYLAPGGGAAISIKEQ